MFKCHSSKISIILFCIFNIDYFIHSFNVDENIFFQDHFADFSSDFTHAVLYRPALTTMSYLSFIDLGYLNIFQ